MKGFLRFLVGFFFALLFSVFILLTSLKFQLLSYEFLTQTLEKDGLYTKISSVLDEEITKKQSQLGAEEEQVYRELAKRLNPQLAREIFETNIKEWLTFINGEKKELTLYFPLQKLGVSSETGLQNDRIPISQFLRGDAAKYIQMIHGIGKIVDGVWIGTLVVLIILILIHFSLNTKINDIKTGMMLVSNSVTVLGSVLVSRLFLDRMLVDPSTQSEALKLLTSSLITEITNLWMLVSLLFLLVGLLFIAFQVPRKEPLKPQPAIVPAAVS